MSATFTTLFERSRYSGAARLMGMDQESREKHQKQRERFAVGMIAFTMCQDQNFRKHFLERVCRFPLDLAGADGWDILVEPHNWGNLVLRHQLKSSLAVCEFKIDSPLKPHQDPAHEHFNLQAPNGGCAGYGWEIERLPNRKNWADVRYVTIQNVASWEKPRSKNPNLNCIASEWRLLLRPNRSEESPLEREVYDCLAHLGVNIFL